MLGERAARAKLMILLRALHNLRMKSDENAYKYVARVKELKSMLDDAGEAIPERVVVMALLTGLPDRYKQLVNTLLLLGEIPDLDGLLQKLVALEGLEFQSGDVAEGESAFALFSGNSRNC